MLENATSISCVSVYGDCPGIFPRDDLHILWGVGYTFTSGATEAWITDEIGESEAASAFNEQLGGCCRANRRWPIYCIIGSMLSVRVALFRSSVILSPALVLIKRAYDTLNSKNYETS